MAEKKKKLKDKKTLVQPFASWDKDYSRYATFYGEMPNIDPVLLNTDEGVQKGQQLYVEMSNSPHIASITQKRLAAVLKNDWHIKPASESDRDKNIAEFIQNDVIKPHYERMTSYIWDAIPKGFSTFEVMYKVGKNITIGSVEYRMQHRFVFDTDGQLKLITGDTISGERVPDRKFVTSTYRGLDQNYYGTGLLQAIYWEYYFSKNGLLFWTSWLERFGQPITIGTYPGTMSKDDPAVVDFRSMMESFQSDFSAMKPEKFNVEIVEGSGKTTDSYEKFQQYLEKRMTKAYLSSTLSTDEAKYGTRSQGELHRDVAEDIEEADCKFVMNSYNRPDSLIEWFVNANYGPVEDYPKLVIDYEDNTDSKETTEKKMALAAGGLEIGVEHLYEANSIPVPADGDWVISGGERHRKGESPKKEISPGFSRANFAKATQPNKALFDRVDDYYDDLMEATAPQWLKGLKGESLAKKLSKSKSVENALKLIDKYSGDNETAYRDIMEIAHIVGHATVAIETTRNNFAAAEKLLSVDIVRDDLLDLFKIVKPKEAIRFWKKKINVSDAVWESLIGESKQQAFYMQATANEYVRNTAMEYIGASLVDGVPWKTARNGIRAAFENAGIVVKDYYIKNVWLTNTYSAYGSQRWKQLRLAGVKWLGYFTARDSRVRPGHAELDGFSAAFNDPVWNSIFAPNGYRCRCVIVEVETPENPPEFPEGGGPDKGWDYNPGKSNIKAMEANFQEKLAEGQVLRESIRQELKNG